MKLLSPHEYITQATEAISKAKKRVSFISMVITSDASTDMLIDALALAAKRGVEVRVAGDLFTYSELSGQFIPSHYYSKKVRSTTKMARALSHAGVDFHWLGRLNITTASGRTHSKWCVVDDTVFSFGGVNLYEEATRNIDYMFRTENKKLADQLFSEHNRIVRADKSRHSYRSHSLALDKTSTVLFDAGLFGDSLIYERVCALAAESIDITYVSQYCPTGKLTRLLKHTSSTLYFNPWKTAHGFNRFVIRLGMLLTKQHTAYTRDTYLHAKCIIFKKADGTKHAITGSHNFVHGGVLLGTREIALETSDPAIIEQLETFIARHIA
jgi:cardiolipin synthase